MRASNLKSFEKTIASNGPNQLKRLYLVLSADDFERRQAINSILSFVLAPDGFTTRMYGPETTVAKVLDALDSPALFGSDSVVVVDEADKKLIEGLSTHFQTPPSFGFLIIGAKIKASAARLEEHGAVLDLIDERPWEKEKRWTEMLHAKAQAAGKRLSPDAVHWMIERLERDAALLASEMDKLLCYSASKTAIEKSDVEEICSASRTHTIWQIADDLVWSKTYRADAGDLRDPSFFHLLLSSLRQQLTIGAKMHDLLNGHVPIAEWGSHFPKIWPKTLEKKAMAAKRLGAAYFRDGLDRLFEMELLAKSSSAPVDALLDFFRIRLMS